MDPRTSFAVALTIFLVGLIGVTVYYRLRAQRVSGEAWETLLGRLTAVDRDKVALIASDLLGGSAEAEQQGAADCFEPEQIWELIGGLEGLEVLAANCDVLIDLACYVQQWYPEALVVAEQLRLNAREIKWHLGRLKGAARVGNLDSAFPDYAQRAISTYFLMTQHLLALYQSANLPGYGELSRAI